MEEKLKEIISRAFSDGMEFMANSDEQHDLSWAAEEQIKARDTILHLIKEIEERAYNGGYADGFEKKYGPPVQPNSKHS